MDVFIDDVEFGKFMKPDSATAAKLAGLIISDRSGKGITRKNISSEEDGIEWQYKSPKGKLSKERIVDLNALAVPPAWTEVWYCSNERGHIQATGYDAKGRVQYRYHPDWIKIKTDLKYAGVDEFALALPSLRERVKDDLDMKGMPLEKAVALVIRLMDIFHIRIGSDEYAKENESYGLTTLQEGHVRFIRGKKAEGKLDAVLDFTGKSGKHWHLLIEDDNLAKMIEDSGKVGGNEEKQDLFRYLDDSGRDFDIKATHINRYIEEATGISYTAKNFRTWAASWKTGARLALISEANEEEMRELAESSEIEDDEIIIWRNVQLKKAASIAKLASKDVLLGQTDKQKQATLLAVIDTVAGDLGNTRAVCRSSYIRPMFMDDWEEGIFMQRWQDASKMPPIPELSAEETTAVHYMRTHE
jgi:DNA topoisomerase-1